MFIRYFLDLPDPFDRVEAALLSEPSEWIPGIARDADDAGERLLSEIGFALTADRRVDKEVEIAIGAPSRSDTQTRLPMSWTATGPTQLFPSLEADLEVASLGPSRTQISISGRYRPPLGPLGRMLDRAMLHRVAEATVKDFLDRLGTALDVRVRATARGRLRTRERVEPRSARRSGSC